MQDRIATDLTMHSLVHGAAPVVSRLLDVRQIVFMIVRTVKGGVMINDYNNKLIF